MSSGRASRRTGHPVGLVVGSLRDRSDRIARRPAAGDGLGRPASLAGARRHRRRPADDRPRRVDREHRAADAPRRTSASATPTGSGSSRPTRWPSAACCCSAAASPTTPAASARSSSACSASPRASALGGLAPNAGLLFAARALQGAFAALMAPAALSLDHGDVHRAQGAGQGVRRLRRDRRRRRGDRPDRRRRPHRVRLVALVPRRQRARSRSSSPSPRSRSCTRARRPATPATTSPASLLGDARPGRRWSTASPRRPRPRTRRPQRHAVQGWTRLDHDRLPGRRRRPAGRVRRLGDGARRTRCCRCGSCSTATAAAPT